MEIDSDTSSPLQKDAEQSTNTKPISPAERIAELNQVDASISTLLSSASTATSILSNLASPSSSSTLTVAQENFTQAASTYFSTLSSIEVRLRRQVYALEEAGLIMAGDERDARRGRTLNSEEGVRRGGGGALDPSWLNAMVSDGVEMGIRREILERARALVNDTQNAGAGEDVDMESNKSEKG